MKTATLLPTAAALEPPLRRHLDTGSGHAGGHPWEFWYNSSRPKRVIRRRQGLCALPSCVCRHGAVLGPLTLRRPGLVNKLKPNCQTCSVQSPKPIHDFFCAYGFLDGPNSSVTWTILNFASRPSLRAHPAAAHPAPGGGTSVPANRSAGSVT